MSLPTLYLNENIAIRMVNLLSISGIKAVHTCQVGNQGVDDNFQLEYAAKHSMILVTHNRLDFKRIHRKWIEEGKSHAGILVVKCAEPETLAARISLFFKNVYKDLRSSFFASPPSIPI